MDGTRRHPIEGGMEQGLLSDEERCLLRLLASGRDTRQIARAMSASDSTVKRALRRLQLKLGARNRVHAVHIATKKGLI